MTLPALSTDSATAIETVINRARSVLASSPSLQNKDDAVESYADIGSTLAAYSSDIDAHDEAAPSIEAGYRYILNDLRSRLQDRIALNLQAPVSPSSPTGAFVDSLTTSGQETFDALDRRASTGFERIGTFFSNVGTKLGEEAEKYSATLRVVLIIAAVAIGLALIVAAYVYFGE